MEFSFLVVVALVVATLLVVIYGIRVVQQSECVIIERFGRYHKTLKSGFNVINPICDRSRPLFWIYTDRIAFTSKVDMRETVLDVPEQSVITKDNVQIHIDALLYVQIIDPVKATYEISNLPLAVSQLAQTTLRNVIGEMELDQTLSSRDVINTKLKIILDEATDKWGTKVNRVELKNIKPPVDIQQAMEKQMQAERERRAKVLQAEGDKQARIQRSEGLKQEQINLAEGEKEAQIRHAVGEASAIKEVATAKRQALEEIKASLKSEELTTKYIVASQYIEALKTFQSKQGDKIFLPYEASTSLGAIGSIKELLREDKK